MDGFTRRLLAIWITFDPPSYRSVMMVLRVCVLRHGRLPETVVVDNGKEFKSTYLNTLLACYEVIKAVRYDPWDVSVAYALMGNLGWVRCRSEHWISFAGIPRGNCNLPSQSCVSCALTVALTGAFAQPWVPGNSRSLCTMCKRRRHLSCAIARPPTGRWSDLYRRLLRVMEEPLIDRRVKLARHPSAEPKPAFPVAETKGTAALRESFESALRHRRPVVVMLDDAQRFARVTGSRKLSDQQDVIQSLADEADVLFILLGTYQLTQFIGLSGQLARRTTTVHLPRYRIAEPAEANAFLSVLDNFQRHLPLERPPDLLAQHDLLYRRSVGCVGILKDWLTKALWLAGQSRSQSITLELLKKTAPDVASCHTIPTEAAEGELLLDINSDESALERKLRTAKSPEALPLLLLAWRSPAES